MGESLIDELVNASKETNRMIVLLDNSRMLLNNELRPIIFFGAGALGVYYHQQFILGDIDTQYLFCDNDSRKWGTKINGIPVISFDQLKSQYRSSYIVITSSQYCNEIMHQLEKYNLQTQLIYPLVKDIMESNFLDPKDNINYLKVFHENVDKFTQVYDTLSDNLSKEVFIARVKSYITANVDYIASIKSASVQYFDKDIITLTQTEIFIDGGGFNGDTVKALYPKLKENMKRSTRLNLSGQNMKYTIRNLAELKI